MLSLEQVFRLSSLAILSVLFISVSATAEKNAEQKSQKSTEKPSDVFAQAGHIEEAELINSGIYNASNLTTIGNRLEIMQGAQNLK